MPPGVVGRRSIVPLVYICFMDADVYLSTSNAAAAWLRVEEKQLIAQVHVTSRTTLLLRVS